MIYFNDEKFSQVRKQHLESSKYPCEVPTRYISNGLLVKFANQYIRSYLRCSADVAGWDITEERRIFIFYGIDRRHWAFEVAGKER